MAESTGKVRVHEFAKSLGLTAAELREKVAALGVDMDVSHSMKTLTAEQVAAFHAADGGAAAPAAEPVRIYVLARERGVSSKELREQIVALGFDWDVSNHMKTLTPEQIAELDAAAGGAKKPAAKKAAKKPAAKKPAAKKAAKKDDEGDEKKAKKSTKKSKKDDEGDEKKAKKSTKKPKKDDGDEKEAKKSAKKAKKGDDAKKDDDRGRGRGKRRDDTPDPEGFDPVPAATRYLSTVLAGLGVRARVTGKYDGRRLRLNVDGPNVSGLLGALNAGAQPELIDGLQTLAGRAAFGDRSGTKSTHIDVDGFRAGRVAALERAAKRISEFVAASGMSVRLPAMNSFDRYAFHQTAAKVRDVWSESEGEGVFRLLGIKPRGGDKTDEAPEQSDKRDKRAKDAPSDDTDKGGEGDKPEGAEASEAAADEKPRGRRRRRERAEGDERPAETASSDDANDEEPPRRRRRRRRRTDDASDE